MKFNHFSVSTLTGVLVAATGWLSSAAFAKETTLQHTQSGMVMFLLVSW